MDPRKAQPEPPHIKQLQTCGSAVNHWNMKAEDIQLMQDLKTNSYRFSIEWARVEPECGRFDLQALRKYSEEVDVLLAANIVPMITLHHFTHPDWFDDLGGFEETRNIEYFSRFAKVRYYFNGNMMEIPYAVVRQTNCISLFRWCSQS